MTISLFSGLEDATNIVNVANASLLILSLSSLYKELFFSKKYKNIVAPILLLPSIKLWFLTMKYNNALALSSVLDTNHFHQSFDILWQYYF